jgi:hypothetical protein
MELMENGNFCLFAANQNGKLLAVFCKQKMENGSLFSLVSKQQTVNNVCCVSKHACLCVLVFGVHVILSVCN